MNNLEERNPSLFDGTAATSYSRRRIAIVGNAPPTSDLADCIDSADFVIRFNRPQGFGAENGERIDLLCLINSGGQAEEWLQQRTLTQEGYFKASRSILFPNDPTILDRYHPQSIELADGGASSHSTDALRQWIEAAGKPVDVVSQAQYLQTFASLGLHRHELSKCWLSSGILATAYALARAGEHDQVEIYGFSWCGWEGHPWAQEKQWYAAAHTRKQLWIANRLHLQ